MADEAGGAGDDWQLAARQHRQVAAMVAAADRAGVATAQLPTVRAKLLEQSARLAEAALRAGASAPYLTPTADDVAAAGPALGDLSDAAAENLVRNVWLTLAEIDAALGATAPASVPLNLGSTGPAPAGPVPPAPQARTGELNRPWPDQPPARWPEPMPTPQAPPTTPVPAGATAWTWRSRGVAGGIADAARRSVALRNAAIYGCYSAAVLATQVVLFVLLDEENSLPMAAPLCLVVLPALAWAAGYLTISALFAPPAGRTLNRSPRLGLAICLVPNALLLCAVGVLFAVDLARH